MEPHPHPHPTTTKSIDVDGIFLLDLSLNESDTSNQCHLDYQQSSSKIKPTATKDDITVPDDSTYYQIGNTQTRSKTHHQSTTNSSTIADHYQLGQHQHQHQQQQQQQASNTYRQPHYLASSLDRLASVINCDEQQQLGETTKFSSSSNICDDEPTVTLVEPQQPPMYRQQHHLHNKQSRSSCSFSDESFAPSSDASLSASFTGSSDDDDAYDRDSTTTREDSGVLDMKDLEGQLNSYNSFENTSHTSSSIYHQQDQSSSDRDYSTQKPISSSNNIMAKNLISNNKAHFEHHHSGCAGMDPCARHGQPTDTTGNQEGQRHLNHRTSRRRVSGSLPIQVPARQMRKDLNKMKLNLLKEEQVMEQDLALGEQDGVAQQKMTLNKNKNHNLAIFEDDDTFLDQEYNANHHNHYPINEYDDENLTAGDDPIKLFASIQALARSLHEDTEIFGSLPPKRTLESPIRSMALV